MSNRKELEDKIYRAKKDIELAQQAINKHDRECLHIWSESIRDYIHHKGYTSPGDTPGTMGIDFRGACYIEPSNEKRWKRICQKCGKVEYTKRIEEIKTEKPKW